MKPVKSYRLSEKARAEIRRVRRAGNFNSEGAVIEGWAEESVARMVSGRGGQAPSIDLSPVQARKPEPQL